MANPFEEIPELAEAQKKMAQKVARTAYAPQKGDLIFSLDIQYVEEDAFVAIDVLRWQEGAEKVYLSLQKAGMEYRPRYFSFREGPPLLAAILALEEKLGKKASCLLVDGHGIAHPRRLGVASWLGVQLDRPSIGMAKRPLLAVDDPAGEERGSISPIVQNEELLGYALRTQAGVKPIYISIGHKIDLETAREMVLQLADQGYRIPEPIRRADHAARAFAKGQSHLGQVF